MAFLEGTKALEKWCRVVTADYENVNILNMSTSWRSGLGFCAIIHHFRPELIDFESLDPDDILGNNQLAFGIAEQHCGIPALLDPQDMVECELLDRLSILTYLSQFYQAFHGATAPAAGMAKRSASSRSSSATSSPAKSLHKLPLTGRRNEPCKMCGQPVFILERLNVTGKLLHRTCFKCARCGTQLNIVNYYETENGHYCCDMCPDEETNQAKVVEANKKMVSEVLDSGLEDSSSEDEHNNNHHQGDSSQTNESLDNDRVRHCSDENSNVTPNSTRKSPAQDVGTQALILPPTQDASSVPAHQDEEAPLPSVPSAKESKPDGEPKPEEGDAQRSASADAVDGEGSSLSDVQAQPILEEKEGGTDPQDAPEVGADLPSKETDDVSSVQRISSSDAIGEAVPQIQQTPTLGEDDVSDATEVEHDANPPANNIPTVQVTQDESIPVIDHDELVDNVVVAPEEPKEAPTDVEIQRYPGDLNPFGENCDAQRETPKSQAPNDANGDEDKLKADPGDAHADCTNPFGSDCEEEGNVTDDNQVKPVSISQSTPLAGPNPLPKPPRLNASLNPFGSDFEDDEEDESHRSISSPTPSSASSMRSRKKRPAPKPPASSSTPIPSPRASVRGPVPSPRGVDGRAPSPSLSIASHKQRPAPPPPRPPPPKELPKQLKDMDNQKRRSQMLETGSMSSECSSVTQTSSSLVLTPLSPDKAMEGQWKRKKGPAPPRPMPQKRQVKKIPRKAVNTELHDIEIKQQELERQGVRLEKTIRELCEKSDRERCEQGLDITDRDSLGPEVEDLIIQLFDLVNEKNDLFRRQTELMYMKRDHRLEEEHADIEHQIRLLMAKLDSQKTDEEKAKEEKLILRLMEIVSQRNEIVDCMEMDRLRELEEDESIEIHMGEYAAIKPTVDDTIKKKLKKKKEKKKKKKDKNFDADKDVDTKEFPNHQSPKPSPKKPGGDKDKAKKLKKKLWSTLSVSTSSLKKS